MRGEERRGEDLSCHRIEQEEKVIKTFECFDL